VPVPEPEPAGLEERTTVLGDIRIYAQPRDDRPAGQIVPGPRPLGLSPGHFRRIAVNGFGDGSNSYPWSCAWYEDHLYVGTVRHILPLFKTRVPLNSLQAWPVPVPESDKQLDLCGQVWRYSPRTETWERVYRSPLTKGVDGRDVPLAYGFRNMSVFQGKSDTRPALYTIPSCGRWGKGPIMLRSTDGRHFDVVGEQGLGLGDPNIVTFRGNLTFKGKLFISPSGSRGGRCNTSFNAVILCSGDPARGNWQASNPVGFGDPTNSGIFDIGVCGNYLYAGTINIRQGCQLWKTDAEGPPPHKWTKVLDWGADRGMHNQAIISFAEFQGDMYLGTGIQNGGHDRDNNIGPAAGEVIRVHPDDSWDLVMGEARMTRFGLKVPTSGLGPGFDNPFAGYIWRMRRHEDGLYVGTFDSTSCLPFSNPDLWPEWVQRLIDRGALERFMKARGGCELWRTTDGDNWVPVTRNGFGNWYNWGVRGLLSTPIGLVVGMANPFGPKVAVRGAGGWRYEDNPQGGLEIWLGSPEHAGSRDADNGSTGGADLVPWGGEDGAIPFDHLAGLAKTPGDGAGPDRDDGLSEGFELLETITGTVLGRDFAAYHDRHAIGELEAADEKEWRLDPVQRLAAADKDLVGLSEDVADEVAEFFNGSTMRNVGYWPDAATAPRQACPQLVEELLALLPPAGPETSPASFLVIGTGADEMAAQVRRHQPAASITTAAEAAAGRLPGAEAAFDVVLWVEGPSATDRTRALAEIGRVLKPGGRLLAADLVGTPATAEPEPAPEPGNATLLRDYQAELEMAGLRDVRVLDVTRETWLRFFSHSREHFATKVLFQQIDRDQQTRIFAALPGGGRLVQAYFFVCATRPGASD
jgi:SAM-dependent methyltransferase